MPGDLTSSGWAFCEASNHRRKRWPQPTLNAPLTHVCILARLPACLSACLRFFPLVSSIAYRSALTPTVTPNCPIHYVVRYEAVFPLAGGPANTTYVPPARSSNVVVSLGAPPVCMQLNLLFATNLRPP